jgi:hypothetical protein
MLLRHRYKIIRFFCIPYESNISQYSDEIRVKGRGFFPIGVDSYLLHNDWKNSGADPASYPVDNRGSFPGDKAAEAYSRLLTTL